MHARVLTIAAVAMSKGSFLTIVTGVVAGEWIVGTAVVLARVNFLEVMVVLVPFRTHLAASKIYLIGILQVVVGKCDL